MSICRGWEVGLLTLGLVVLPQGRASAQEPAQGGNCVACHSAMGTDRLAGPTRSFPDDIHAQRGFGCVSCHGGDANAPGMAGMDPALGFIAKPEGEQVIQVCGSCHSNAEFMRQYNPAIRVDQVAEYVTSVHGMRLAQLGDPNVATCVSCHPAHNIRPRSDPLSSVYPLNVAATCGRCHADADYMEEYDIPTNQLDEYHGSVHWENMEGGDLSAPTCNDCHGNHGAAPPGVSWVGNVCGQCHSVMADNFASSRHGEVFTSMGRPGCATCHQNHRITAARDDMLGLGEGAVCSMCHGDGDAGGMTAVAMRAMIDSLVSAADSADALLSHAENAGIEVGEDQYELIGARNALVSARAAVHRFVLDSVRVDFEEGMEIARGGQARGMAALQELSVRRTGLVVSVTIILIMIGALVAKIRQIESKPEA